jgi:hypothetical protein
VDYFKGMEYPTLTKVLAEAKNVVLRNYKGFDVIEVSKDPGAYILFDHKYNSWGKKNYSGIEDAKQAADDMYADRLQMAGYKTIAKIVKPSLLARILAAPIDIETPRKNREIAEKEAKNKLKQLSNPLIKDLKDFAKAYVLNRDTLSVKVEEDTWGFKISLQADANEEYNTDSEKIITILLLYEINPTGSVSYSWHYDTPLRYDGSKDSSKPVEIELKDYGTIEKFLNTFLDKEGFRKKEIFEKELDEEKRKKKEERSRLEKLKKLFSPAISEVEKLLKPLAGKNLTYARLKQPKQIEYRIKDQLFYDEDPAVFFTLKYPSKSRSQRFDSAILEVKLYLMDGKIMNEIHTKDFLKTPTKTAPYSIDNIKPVVEELKKYLK